MNLLNQGLIIKLSNALLHHVACMYVQKGGKETSLYPFQPAHGEVDPEDSSGASTHPGMAYII